MTYGASLSNYTFTRMSTKNGDYTTFMFNLTIKIPYYDGDIIELITPS